MSSSNENLGPDPSMDEILSSIRRILKEDERTQPDDAPPSPVTPSAQAPHQMDAGQMNVGQMNAGQTEPGQTAQRLGAAQPRDENSDSVLILDPSMMVSEARSDGSASAFSLAPPASAPAPSSAPAPFSPPIRPTMQAGGPQAAMPQVRAPQRPSPAMQAPRPAASVQPPEGLLGESAAESASSHLGALMRSIPPDRGAAASHAGPTLEDVVRDELRPLLRGWLDANLPPLVERIVRAEIERLVARTKL